jgi:ADP-ribose pyrophosphatase YjhB (NUDIX family)
VSQLIFRPSVYAVIIEDERVLLSKQWDGYDFPGGGIELGETIEEALAREVKEETGLDIRIDKLITCVNSFFKLQSTGQYIHSILIYYLCKITGGDISIELADESEKQYMSAPEWISLEANKQIKFYNSVDSLMILKEAIRIKKSLDRDGP